jgi:hypothetical protein
LTILVSGVRLAAHVTANIVVPVSRPEGFTMLSAKLRRALLAASRCAAAGVLGSVVFIPAATCLAVRGHSGAGVG